MSVSVSTWVIKLDKKQAQGSVFSEDVIYDLYVCVCVCACQIVNSTPQRDNVNIPSFLRYRRSTGLPLSCPTCGQGHGWDTHIHTEPSTHTPTPTHTFYAFLRASEEAGLREQMRRVATGRARLWAAPFKHTHCLGVSAHTSTSHGVL